MPTSLQTIKTLIEKMKRDMESNMQGTLESKRRLFDETGMNTALPDGTCIAPVSISSTLGAEWIVPAHCQAHAPVLLYLHGGGYSIGSPRSHRPICARIAHSAGCRILSLDYRLAPEHKYPAALLDALQAYRFLLGSHPDSPVFIAGDSAGGGLAMACLLAIRNEALPMPTGAIGISAWLDLECSSDSYRTNGAIDLLASAEGLRFVGRAYAHKSINHDPLISPYYAQDLSRLCPILLQVGSAETLLDENRKFAEQALHDGIEAELQIWPNMVHVWHSLYGLIPEAAEALSAIAQWMHIRSLVPER